MLIFYPWMDIYIYSCLVREFNICICYSTLSRQIYIELEDSIFIFEGFFSLIGCMPLCMSHLSVGSKFGRCYVWTKGVRKFICSMVSQWAETYKSGMKSGHFTSRSFVHCCI